MSIHIPTSSRGPKTGWGTSGKLTTGDLVGQVTLQANFEETGTYTIEFSMDTNALSNNPIFAEALITWSIEGNYLQRRVNVADGISVSGVGQAVKIQMMDATSNITGPINAVQYGVACQVAKGVRGSNKQPPTLVPRGTLPPSADGSGNGSGNFTIGPGPISTLFVPVPQNSGLISLFVTTLDTSTGTSQPGDIIIVQQYNGTVVRDYDPYIYRDWVPLAAGVDAIEIFNTNPSDTYRVSLTFGVDG
jgi:hypothetical protein